MLESNGRAVQRGRDNLRNRLLQRDGCYRASQEIFVSYNGSGVVNSFQYHSLGNTTTGAPILSSFQPNEPYVAIIIDANLYAFHETYLLDGYDGGKEAASVFRKQLCI